MIKFKNRQHAGQLLAQKLLTYQNNPNTLVLGLPRGGVVTAFEVAQALHLPLDIVVPRKIGAPDNPELAIGAVTEDGTILFDKEIVALLKPSKYYLENTIEQEKKEAKRRLSVYRGNRPPLELKNKVVILIDDGIATGATMRAAIASVKARHAQKIIVAVPVAPQDTTHAIAQEVDEVIMLSQPPDFIAISAYYDYFEQTTDQEVIELMNNSKITS